MSVSDLTKTIERHNLEMDRAVEVAAKTDRTLARYERVMERVDAHDGAAREARRREYERVMGGFGAKLIRAGIAVGAVSILAIILGWFFPLGILGFVGAVGLAIGLAAMAAMWGGPKVERLSDLPQDVSNAIMIARFDSYLTRKRNRLPQAARAEIDAIHKMVPDFKKSLSRVPTLDPNAQEARRLMSKHLPGLIERYEHVPEGLRDSIDGEGMSVDERLVDGLKAGRKALSELAETIAKADMQAFETQGRFIQSRYGKDEEAL
ncbi:hypothetical protein [Sphingomicrobium clamense]|uniref:5-bromo-4-chloroindolyl phosphate hydrolysis protein n=1 Tax=Sphingomicrobium clamense TaxID=2851013 RepID=A0ABS6V5B4_9SPHN|nr:hypothetical protein [Sphingomicrobium sp. B8]MBW0144754.1 hypothetical protein [Sphingomicrobium sp. B8]